MKLKQVRLSGFKSFCDEAELAFKDEGITIIVGPNGCGKSNVVDAVRWALGEQSPRLMRSSAMGDVIFAGSASRKPVGRAEVTLLFDNSDGTALEKYSEYSEIAVTRRLYRSGDSEYLINKAPCRLMDVRELLMDTGAAGRSYSIVEQGRVDEFVTASPADRRAFMEEAAGIVRYKTKRQAAEKKLEQTRQNLLRVEDVLGELNRQEVALRDQMEAAREYLALQEEIGLLSGDLARLRHNKAARTCRDLEQQLDALRAEDTGIQQALARLGAQLHEGNLEQARRETGLRETREAVRARERELQQDETALALEKQNQTNARQWHDQLQRSLDELRRRRVELAEQRQALTTELEALERSAEALRVEIAREEGDHAERKAEAEALTHRVQTLQERLLESHTALHGIENQQALLADRLAENERRRTALDEQAALTDSALAEARTTVEAHTTRLTQLTADREAAETTLDVLHERITADEAALEAHQQRESELDQAVLATRSRLETLSQIEADYQGFGETVRGFLAWLADNPAEREALGVLGPLADLIQVPGDVAAWAGDYLAPYLELIVLREAGALPRVAQTLQALELGGVRVIALDRLPATNGDGTGAERLSDRIAFTPEARALAAPLFGSVRLLPEGGLAQPLPAPQAPLEWLGRDGSVYADAKGRIMLGHEAAPAAGILQRRAEIAELEARLAGQEQAQQDARAETARRRERIAHFREERRLKEDERNELLLAQRTAEQEQAHSGREAERLAQVAAGHTRERERLETEAGEFAAQRDTLTADAERWRETRTKLDGEVSGARTEEERVRADLAELNDHLTERKVEQSRTQSRLESLEARSAELERGAEETEARTEEAEEGLARQDETARRSAEAIERLEAALEAHRGALDTLREQERERQEAFHEHEQTQRRLADQLRDERRRHELSQQRAHEVELALTAEKMRLEQFAAQLADLPEHDETAELPDEKTLESRLNVAQARLRRMEGVNLGAPQEYDALTERLGFLRTQQDDLVQAIEDLEASIRRMNAESRKRFRETFDQVNEKFQALFPEVFGGGEARLIMTDSDDPLEAGVDIVAQPPGKKLQSLNLLSGGEKALTAIALIFSFFLHKPSPFCLLDEVDAPLDDVNVTRFNRLVTSMTEHSQFIIISHNKRTMEVGDYLYGVTMEEAGVSKIVSVNLAALT